MKRDDIDQSEIERHLVREVQGMYPKEHQALENWGRWSRDLRGVYPADIKPSRIYSEANREDWDKDGYGDVALTDEMKERLLAGDRKAERPEEEPHDPKTAAALDERIHGQGGLPDYLRSILRTAYVTREVPEHQFHKLCNPPCMPATFRERLEDCLIWTGRLI